jgi:hypothetical protein
MTETITFPNGYYSYHQTFTEIVRFIDSHDLDTYDYKRIGKVAMDFETKNKGRIVWMGRWQTELHDFVSSSGLITPTVTVTVTIRSIALNSDDKRTFPANEQGYIEMNEYLKNIRQLYMTAVGKETGFRMGTGFVQQQADKSASLTINIS